MTTPKLAKFQDQHNEQVKNALKTKRECFKALKNTRDDQNFSKYKKANKEVKKMVSGAYDKYYARFDTKVREKGKCKLAKLGERKTRDVSQITCIKGEDL